MARLSILILALHLSALEGFAAPAEPGKTARPAKAEQPKTLTPDQSFDVGQRRLQSPPVWHTPELVWSKLDTSSLKKGEFETTTAFEARVQARKQIVTELRTKGHLFAMPPLDAVTFEYDADGRAQRVTVLASSLPREIDRWYELDMVCVAEKGRRDEKYVAENAFGKKVLVTRSDSTRLCVAAKPKAGRRFSGAFPFELDAAKRAKGHLKAAIVFPPGEIVTGSTHFSPTIDLPYSGIEVSKVMMSEAIRLLVYDDRNGEVLSILDASEPEQTQTPTPTPPHVDLTSKPLQPPAAWTPAPVEARAPFGLQAKPLQPPLEPAPSPGGPK